MEADSAPSPLAELQDFPLAGRPIDACSEEDFPNRHRLSLSLPLALDEQPMSFYQIVLPCPACVKLNHPPPKKEKKKIASISPSAGGKGRSRTEAFSSWVMSLTVTLSEAS